MSSFPRKTFKHVKLTSWREICNEIAKITHAVIHGEIKEKNFNSLLLHNSIFLSAVWRSFSRDCNLKKQIPCLFQLFVWVESLPQFYFSRWSHTLVVSLSFQPNSNGQRFSVSFFRRNGSQLNEKFSHMLQHYRWLEKEACKRQRAEQLASSAFWRARNQRKLHEDFAFQFSRLVKFISSSSENQEKVEIRKGIKIDEIMRKWRQNEKKA